MLNGDAVPILARSKRRTRGARAERARSCTVAIALLASACGPTAELIPFDASVGVDATRSRDASFDAPRVEDAGQPPPVLPAQHWQLSFDLFELPRRTVQAAISLDARAEAGGVRAVVGANGRTANVWFDVLRPGQLHARAPFELGLSVDDADCRGAVGRVDGASLRFVDSDDDGVFETLVEMTGDLTTSGPMGSAFGSLEARATLDVDPPTLTVVPERPLPGDVLALVSSEPLDPRFVPYVERDGLRQALEPVLGGSAPSRWVLPLQSVLPGTGYTLHADGEARDLAGHLGALPEASFDVVTPSAVVDLAFETSIAGVAAEGGARVVEAPESPLGGSRSVLGVGRTLLVLTPPRGTRQLSLVLRLHTTESGAAAPILRVRDLAGRLLGSSAAPLVVDQHGTIDGYAYESTTAFGAVTMAETPETVVLEIEPHGSWATCSGGIAPRDREEAIAITLDDLSFS